MKERLDVLLVQRGHAASREKAKAVIMAGCVYVNGQKEDKAGSMFDCAAEIEVRGNTLRYVSRGGLKLEKAMKNFGVELEGKVCSICSRWHLIFHRSKDRKETLSICSICRKSRKGPR